MSVNAASEPTKNIEALALPQNAGLLINSLTQDGGPELTPAVANIVTGAATSSVEEWLGHFGTAQLNLNVDENGKWDNSSFDFLAPLYDNKKSVLFTQLGVRSPDGRTTGNFGLGVRTFNTKDWMFGGNVFLDDDFTGKNRRVGAGAEAWTDNLKLAANTYAGTTEWHSSRDFDNYNEKPADGFDIRAEAYLPTYPQLGTKVMYEKYYGENVALFDTDHLQHNPSAVTFGLNYTPIPLITVGMDYKRGQDSMDDTRLSLNIRYAIGQSWQSQISSEQVAVRRSLAGSRYDLVDRNNEIVMQYKKKDETNILTDIQLASVKDNSPADGASVNTITAHTTTSDGKPVSGATLHWSVATGSATLSAITGVTDANGNASVNLTSRTAGQNTVQVISGDISRTTTSAFTLSVASLNLKLQKNNAQANGIEQNSGQVTLKDASGKTLAGVAVTWLLEGGATIVGSDATTDKNGQAGVNFTNTKPGDVKLTATAEGKTESVQSSFMAQAASSVNVTTTTNNAPADGITTDVARAVITDTAGQSMANTSVIWTLSGSAVATSATSVLTDDKGIATVSFKDAVPENVTITASAGSKSGNTTATFTAIAVDAVTVSMTKNNSPADGATVDVAQVKVTDARGNPIPDDSVTWSLSGSAAASSPLTVNTDSSGVATLNLTDVAVENVTVSASSGGKSGNTTAIFTDIPVSAVDVAMTTNNSPADGTAVDVAQVKVTDASGKPITDSSVTWSLSGSATATTPLTVNTDSSGVATLSLTDVKEESVIVSASVGAKVGNTTAVFTAIPVSAVDVTMTTDKSPADNGTNDAAQVLVTDAKNQPMANVPVTWSLSNSTTANLTSPENVTTNASGIAIVTLKDSAVESVGLTASAGGKKDTTTATFTQIVAKHMALNVTANNALADDATINSVKATVTDGDGHTIEGTSVAWSIGGSATAHLTTQAVVETDASGVATVSLKDSVAEPVTVIASADGLTNTTAVVFTALPVNSVSVTTTKDNAPADGAATNAVQAVVKDTAGKPVPNTPVTWALSGSAAPTSATTVNTDSSGTATLSLNDTVPENVTISASAGGKSGNTTATFTAIPVNTIVVSMTTNHSAADGLTANKAQVNVTDASGKPIAGSSVTWSLSGSATATTPLTVNTDSSGVATLSFTDVTVENVTVSASSGGKSDSASADFTLTPANSVTVSMVTDNSPANGVAEDVAQTIVLDAHNNPIEGADVNWAVSGSATPHTATTQTDHNGTATLRLKNTVAESVMVSATTRGLTGTKQATFIADSATAHVTTLVLNTDNSPASGQAKNSATATVTDADNNLVTNKTVIWSVTGSAGLTSGTSVTDSNGQATMTFTDTKAETVTLTAKAGSSDAGLSKVSNFVADSSSAHVSVLTITTDYSPADGTSQNSSTATVVDANNNPVANSVVNWTYSGSRTAQLAASTSSTDSSGRAVMTYTDTQQETFTLSAGVSGTPTQSQNTTFALASFNPDHLTIVATTNGHGITSGSPNRVVVTAYDSNNEPMKGVGIALSDDMSGGHVSYNPQVGTTDSTGSTTSSITSNIVGGGTITATSTNSTGTQKKASVFMIFSTD